MTTKYAGADDGAGMTDIDQLEGLELVEAFAEAIGYKALISTQAGIIPHVAVNRNTKGYWDVWTELPADLILREFNRVKPSLCWRRGGAIRTYTLPTEFCNVSAKGPSLETALARLVVKIYRGEK